MCREVHKVLLLYIASLIPYIHYLPYSSVCLCHSVESQVDMVPRRRRRSWPPFLPPRWCRVLDPGRTPSPLVSSGRNSLTPDTSFSYKAPLTLVRSPPPVAISTTGLRLSPRPKAGKGLRTEGQRTAPWVTGCDEVSIVLPFPRTLHIKDPMSRFPLPVPHLHSRLFV